MAAINIGIIGYGRIGAEHAAWLAQCGELSVSAVADVTEARRRLAQPSG